MSKLHLNSPRVSRRDLLRAGGVGAVGLGLSQSGLTQAGLTAASQDSYPQAILVVLNGGPSPFETFDPKPDAPLIVRGPFRSIATRVPGVRLSETLPGIAERLDRCCLIRSLTTDAPPLHEAGMQLLLTGGLARRKERHPHIGQLVEQGLSVRGERSNWIEIDDDSIRVADRATGQAANPMMEKFQQALNALDGGARLAVVHTFGSSQSGMKSSSGVKTPSGAKTWDCHGRGHAPATVFDYRDTFCPQFDAAMSSLIDRLSESGRMSQTLVIVAGELGKSSRVNADCGRDDAAGVWSALVVGGKLPAGTVIGASDSHGREPADCPLSICAIPGMLLNWFQVDAALLPGATLSEVANPELV